MWIFFIWIKNIFFSSENEPIEVLPKCPDFPLFFIIGGFNSFFWILAWFWLILKWDVPGFVMENEPNSSSQNQRCQVIQLVCAAQKCKSLRSKSIIKLVYCCVKKNGGCCRTPPETPASCSCCQEKLKCQEKLGVKTIPGHEMCIICPTMSAYLL